MLLSCENRRASLALICSGLHRDRPPSLACTYRARRGLLASFPGFGRRARASARAWATEARYGRGEGRAPGGEDGPGTANRALRRSSRLTVEGERPSRRAISRTVAFCAAQTAISSRSRNDRYRPDSGCSCGFTPPALRKNRHAGVGLNPTPAAAASTEAPARVSVQNWRHTSRRAGGRPCRTTLESNIDNTLHTDVATTTGIRRRTDCSFDRTRADGLLFRWWVRSAGASASTRRSPRRAPCRRSAARPRR